MKKVYKLVITFATLFAVILGTTNITAFAEFSNKGNHWYYSDDKEFKYWGLTAVNEYGMPVDNEVRENINFNGATPESIYVAGKEDYTIDAYVYNEPVKINAKIALRGDVDSNRQVDLYDVIYISKSLLNTYKFKSEFHEFTADYNTDGTVNLYDAIDVSKFILQQIVAQQAAEKFQRDQYRNEILKLVNEERAAVGAGALKLDTKLNNAAQTRSVEISSVFSHSRPDGTSCFTVFDDFKIDYLLAGENIAVGYVSPKSVVEGWMNSPGHKENMLKPEYTKMGIGYYEKTGSIYTYHWAQLFMLD